MADNEIQLAKSGSTPKVEVAFGHAQFGKYQLFLWDANGQNSQKVGDGVNDDDKPDVFDLGSVAALDKRILSWELIVAGFVEDPNQHYSASVTITQDGKTVQGGVFSYSGTLAQGTELLFAHARFIVS